METLTNIFNFDLTIKFIHIIYWFQAPDVWNLSKIPIANHRIVFVIDGEFIAGINGEEYHVKKHNILFTPKNIDYTARCITKTFQFILIEFDTFENNYYNDFFTPLYSLPLNNKCLDYMSSMLELWNKKGITYKMNIKSILYKMLGELASERFKTKSDFSNSKYNTIKKSIEYMEANYLNEFISVDKLAKISGICNTHFTKLFKEIYKTTPISYMNDLKVRKAGELLRYSTLSIGQIAEQTGFSDQYYFSKVFKNIMGVTPSSFRSSKST